MPARWISWAIATAAILACAAVIAVVGVTTELVRGLVGTFVGAALGFIVALYIDRIQRQHADEARRQQLAEEERAQRERDHDAERREEARRTQIAHDRQVAVLGLLREELGRIPDQMGRRQDRRAPPFDRMTDVLWRTFSSSGELRWIDNVELLNSLAAAYDLLAVEIGLEARWQELRLVTGGHSPQTEAHLGGQLKRYDYDTWRRACEACKAMDAALLGAGAPPGSNADSLFCP